MAFVPESLIRLEEAVTTKEWGDKLLGHANPVSRAVGRFFLAMSEKAQKEHEELLAKGE